MFSLYTHFCYEPDQFCQVFNPFFKNQSRLEFKILSASAQLTGYKQVSGNRNRSTDHILLTRSKATCD